MKKTILAFLVTFSSAISYHAFAGGGPHEPTPKEDVVLVQCYAIDGSNQQLSYFVRDHGIFLKTANGIEHTLLTLNGARALHTIGNSRIPQSVDRTSGFFSIVSLPAENQFVPRFAKAQVTKLSIEAQGNEIIVNLKSEDSSEFPDVVDLEMTCH